MMIEQGYRVKLLVLKEFVEERTLDCLFLRRQKNNGT